MRVKLRDKGTITRYDYGSYSGEVTSRAGEELVETVFKLLICVAIVACTPIFLLPMSGWWWVLLGMGVIGCGSHIYDLLFDCLEVSWGNAT